MMESLCQYIIRIIAAALICGFVSGFLKGSAAEKLGKLICGLFLSAAVMGPIAGYTMDIPSGMDFSAAAESAAESGEKMAQEAASDIIKEQLEAYILDKAAELNLNIDIELIMDSHNQVLPVSVRICGSVSPYAKAQLQTFLVSEIGITEENQQWTGES